MAEIKTTNANLAKNALKTGGHKLGFGFWAGSIPDVYMNMRNGDGLVTSVLKAGVNGMAFELLPGVMWGQMAFEVGGAAAKGAMKWKTQRDAWWNAAHNNKTIGGGYRDTDSALTMRQAAVQAIQESKLNARSALGDEARLLPRGLTYPR